MKRLLTLLLAVATVIGLTSVSASAAPVTQQVQSLNAVKAIEHAPTGLLRFRDGMVVSARRLSSTSPDLPRLPRGMRYAPDVLVVKVLRMPNATAPRSPGTAPKSATVAESASGCTPAFGATTCIYVNGSGLRVIYWTTGVNIKKGLTYPAAHYEINGLVRQTDSFEVDSSNGGFYVDPIGWDYTYLYYVNGTPDPVIFGNNTKVCNFWTGASINSLPCETVHA